MNDLIVFGVLVVAAAWLLTTHVAVVYGLARTPPRRDALVALVLPPLAPYWALRRGMHVRGVMWVVALVAYVTARFAAAR